MVQRLHSWSQWRGRCCKCGKQLHLHWWASSMSLFCWDYIMPRRSLCTSLLSKFWNIWSLCKVFCIREFFQSTRDLWIMNCHTTRGTYFWKNHACQCSLRGVICSGFQWPLGTSQDVDIKFRSRGFYGCKGLQTEISASCMQPRDYLNHDKFYSSSFESHLERNLFLRFQYIWNVSDPGNMTSYFVCRACRWTSHLWQHPRLTNLSCSSAISGQRHKRHRNMWGF